MDWINQLSKIFQEIIFIFKQILPKSSQLTVNYEF